MEISTAPLSLEYQIWYDCISRLRARGSERDRSTPSGFLIVGKIAENLQYIADFQQYSQNFKLSLLSHLSSDLGDSKGKVVRFFEGNALVSSDSGLGFPFEVISR